MNALFLYCFILLYFVDISCEKTVIYNSKEKYKNIYREKSHQKKGKTSIEERVKEIIPKNCGLRLTKNYIIGGEEAERHEYPFIVSIRNDIYGNICGGTIITDRWILTAAHCIGDYNNSQFGIIAGTHYYSMGEKYYIIYSKKHKNYRVYENGSGGVFDIALIKTDRKIRFNSNVNAICLPTKQYSEPHGVLTVAGWGAVKIGFIPGIDGDDTPMLRKASLNIISDQKCANINANQNNGIRIIRSYLCAIGNDQNFCYGDSGSPSFQYINGKAVIVGITSATDDKCLPGSINVFTQVSYFVDWILLNISY